GRLLADSVVESQWPLQNAILDLSTVRHLAESGGIHCRPHTRSARLTRSENSRLRILQAERLTEINGVLTNVRLVFEAGCDVDRRVCNEEQLVVAGNVHQEDVTDATRG